MDFSLIAQAKFSWFDLGSWIAILQVVVGLGFIIFVHELGHFLVAKACGVKCEKFYVGFDAFDIRIGDLVLIPRRLFHFQWGETEYGIGIIPLGGYVKMLGQDDNPANQAKERERTLMAQQQAGEDADSDGADDEAEVAVDTKQETLKPVELDPRSYPAKSVPQRLAIISAGVIMNLIFAVIFAMIAYAMGAPYSPAIVGSTAASGPAWKSDMVPGTRVIQINDDVKPPEHLRFKDLTAAILLTGEGQPIRLKSEVPGSESPVTFTLRPESGILLIKGTDLASVGIRESALAKLAPANALVPGLAASKADPPLEPSDQILKVNGVEVSTGHELKRELALIPNEVAVFTVRRKNGEEADTDIEVKIPAQPIQSVGIKIQFAEIAAIQDKSPAAIAGLEEGDELVAIDDQPIVDILQVSQQLMEAAKEGRAVKLTVQRLSDEKESQMLSIPVVPRLPRVLPEANYGHLPHGIDELGVAVRITPIIDSVVEGSSAAAAGLQKGDRLVTAQFLKDGKPIDQRDETNLLPLATVKFSEQPQVWPAIFEYMQYMKEGNSLKLEIQRNGTKETVEVKPVVTSDRYWAKRGFTLASNERILKAQTLGEAFYLGLRQTKEDAGTVYRTLRQMLIGRLSPINLRGPGTIASVATMMAMEGIPEFLLFLTLISANLAVVNFLPIPVLDGGHAMFLIYEGIFRRPVPDQLVFVLSIAGLIFILGLMFFVLTMDVFQWVVF